MASISKRRYWVNPLTGKEVPRETPGAEPRESRWYRIRYKDSTGHLQSVKGHADLRATRQLAARLEAAAAQETEGLVNRFAKHDRRPLLIHVDDYLADLAMHGRDDQYLNLVRFRLHRLVKECHWSRLREISAEAFDDWRRARHGTAGSSGKTLNHFFDALRGFCNWCAAPAARLAKNPIAGLEKLPHVPVFQRQALTADNLLALYKAAPPERYQVYAFAVTTGLRRQEIKDLQWGDVVLDAAVPFLSLRAAATKARRADVFALKAEIAAMLRTMRPQGWQETAKVFIRVPKVKELRADLLAAGVSLPAPVTEGTQDRLDFHALRTTLGSFIGLSGVAERVGMELMRVTDPKLLRKTYCDPRVLGTAQAAADLPIPTAPLLPPTPPTQQTHIQTGTDAAPLATDSVPGRNRTKKVDGESRPEATIGGSGLTTDGSQTLQVIDMRVSEVTKGGESRQGRKQRAKGVEPSAPAPTRGGDFPANFKFPQSPGPSSDNPAIADVSPPSTDPLLEHLTRFWPSLSVALRESLVSLAAAAAKGGAS